MASAGVPLMARVLGSKAPKIWEHYPADDAIDRSSGCRWFYHTHAEGERDANEHGHFHLFLPRSAFPRDVPPLARPRKRDATRPDLVHVAGLSIDRTGLPRQWFATNRWVTDEALYPGDLVAGALGAFDVRQTGEDPQIGTFLTAMVALHRNELARLLAARDRRLRRHNKAVWPERGNGVLAARAIDLDACLERCLAAA